VLRSIHKILNALTSPEIYCKYVWLPPPNQSFPDSVLGTESRRKFVPYFNGCLGALDGSHVPVHVLEHECPRYRNRKGDISQNILLACSLDMLIVYVLSGWEGSAADSRIFNSARKDLKIPVGRYYLGNAGYANSDAVLVPYRGVRYHLKEWGSANRRFVIPISHTFYQHICSNLSYLDLKLTRNCTIIGTRNSETLWSAHLASSRDVSKYLLLLRNIQ
jgi:hypothetical protein